MTNRRRNFVTTGLALAAVGVGLAACAKDATPEPAPASSTEAKKADDFDRDAYCSAMCERSSACGLAEATSLAGKVDGAALDRVKKQADATRGECVTACGKSQLPPYRVSQAKSALACTKRDGCEAFATCLEEVASQ